MQDLIIIGAGPAGITASVYAARKRMNFLVITKDIGGQAAWSSDIENYTGYQFISGPDLVAKFSEHMRQYDIDFRENEEVKAIDKIAERILVKTDKNEYTAKTVIIATGKRAKELKVPGEQEFKNRGLTYCATCDGPLFAKKVVAVIGGGNSALDAAIQLLRIAKHIYIVNTQESLSADAIMREKVEMSNLVTLLNNASVREISGEKFVRAIKISQNGKERELAVEGVFVEIGLIPNADFIEIVAKNEQGEIKINCQNEASVAGIFAAGDVSDIVEKQIIIAAGEGAKAAMNAFRYLAGH